MSAWSLCAIHVQFLRNNKLGLAQWYDLTNFGNPEPDKLPLSLKDYLTWCYAAHENMDAIALTVRSFTVSILSVGSSEPLDVKHYIFSNGSSEMTQ
jgi:hypothetical protein